MLGTLTHEGQAGERDRNVEMRKQAAIEGFIEGQAPNCRWNLRGRYSCQPVAATAAAGR